MIYNKKVRQSNIELLRIIMILAVIGLHYFNGQMGGLLNNVNPGSPDYYVSHVFESLFIIAVNVFVIITGYFSVSKKSIKLRKVIQLYLIMAFYGIVLTITGGLLNNCHILNTKFTPKFQE